MLCTLGKWLYNYISHELNVCVFRIMKYHISKFFSIINRPLRRTRGFSGFLLATVHGFDPMKKACWYRLESFLSKITKLRFKRSMYNIPAKSELSLRGSSMVCSMGFIGKDLHAACIQYTWFLIKSNWKFSINC